MWPKRSGSFLKPVSKKIVRTAIEIVLALFLIAAAMVLRLNYLDADPPIGLSASADVYTDTPQYTLFAKQYIQTGEFNPYNDPRFVFFQKSAVTALSLLVFKLWGISTYTSNMVGLLFSMGAMLMFFLFVRKAFGTVAGLFFLFLIGLNYNLMFYGRLPFLEHAMAFFAFSSLVVLIYWPNRIGYLIAGVLLATSIFFCKVIGLVFLFPFVCYLIYRFKFEDSTDRWWRSGLFAVGFGAVFVVWLVVSYLPSQSQVTGYLGEQAISLYGAPDGLKSVEGFFMKLFSFGEQSKLMRRMKPAAILALVFSGMMVYRMIRKKSWKSGFADFNSGHIFVGAMIVAFYGALMIWNYRPLRYQLVIIYPVYAATASILFMLWRKWKAVEPERVPIGFLPVVFLLTMIPIYQFIKFWVAGGGEDFYYIDYFYVVASWALPISVAIFAAFAMYKRGRLPQVPVLGKVIVLTVFALVIFKGVGDYLYWAYRPSMSARDNSRDLGTLLSPGAVLSGPFAPQLTLENHIGAVIHMFGVSNPDPDLFTRFPITHLVLDKGNEELARRDYPSVMDSAAHLLTSHNGLKKVRLFRVAGHTGNPIADQYQISLFERLVEQFNEGKFDEGNALALEFLRRYPDNMSCYLLLAEAAEQDSVYQLAEAMFKKAVEFSPTNYNLNVRMAQFYKDRYKETGDQETLARFNRYFQAAKHLAPVMPDQKIP